MTATRLVPAETNDMHGRLAIWTLTASVLVLISLVGAQIVFQSLSFEAMHRENYAMKIQLDWVNHWSNPNHPHSKEELKTKRPRLYCPGCFAIQGGKPLPASMCAVDESHASP